MWLVVVVFGLVVTVGWLYEAWAVRYDKPTITELIKRYTHLAIIVGGALFMLLGYALGVGGR